MPTIDYVYFDTYPDHSEINHEICEISDAEWNRRIEQEHHWESNGRMARREVSLFDMIHAEILGEHNAEKARVRNRRKADRKHPENKAVRMRNQARRMRTIYGDMDGNGKRKESYINGELYRDGKCRVAEQFARADYAVECRNRDDALAYHSDYLDMAIDHGERLEYLRKQIRKLDYERMVIANYDREIKYEQNRVNELMRIADTIMEGECY